MLETVLRTLAITRCKRCAGRVLRVDEWYYVTNEETGGRRVIVLAKCPACRDTTTDIAIELPTADPSAPTATRNRRRVG